MNHQSRHYSPLGIPIACLNYQEVLSVLDQTIRNKKQVFCVTINLDILRLAHQHSHYHQALCAADLIFPDGMPLVWLSKFSHTPLPEKVTGSEIVNDLCRIAMKNGYRVFLFGAAPGVAETAKAKLKTLLPTIQVVGTYSPTEAELNSDTASEDLCHMINAADPDILFVALGAPKQELWIYCNRHKLTPYVIVPCGGSIDYIAGVQQTSPRWLANLGFEWLYRLWHNPKRLFQRYIVHDTPFLLWLIFKMCTGKLTAALKQ